MCQPGQLVRRDATEKKHIKEIKINRRGRSTPRLSDCKGIMPPLGHPCWISIRFSSGFWPRFLERSNYYVSRCVIWPLDGCASFLTQFTRVVFFFFFNRGKLDLGQGSGQMIIFSKGENMKQSITDHNQASRQMHSEEKKIVGLMQLGRFQQFSPAGAQHKQNSFDVQFQGEFALFWLRVRLGDEARLGDALRSFLSWRRQTRFTPKGGGKEDQEEEPQTGCLHCWRCDPL